MARRAKPKPKPKAPPAKPRALRRILVRWGLAALVWSGIAFAGYLVWCAYGLPDPDAAAREPRRPAVVIESADGRLLAAYGDLHGGGVRLAEMSPHLIHALLATEDRSFYSHFGIAPLSVARAVWVNLRAGGVRQGASTITQQLAKNLFLSRERTLTRKVQELMLAFWLEAKFGKDQILELYLNRVYFGGGTYGVEAAARRFYARPAKSLDIYQSAALIGALKAPSRYNPLTAPEASDRRARQVIRNLADAGYLSAEQAERVPRRPAVAANAGEQARFFADWVLDAVGDRLGPPARDLWVRSTLDPRAQKIAEEALSATLSREGEKHHVGEGAAVVMDRSGAVRAMVGGRTYVAGGFNRATQAARQPGSTVKPFVYAAAFARGLSPDTVMEDAPVSIGGWSPRNADDRFRGPVTLRQALIHSINTVTVRLWQSLGGEAVRDALARVGLPQAEDAGPSIVLGSGSATLLELTAAYAALANQGTGVWPHGIAAVRDAAGRILDKPSGGGPGRVVDAAAAAQATDILAAVLTEGTGRQAKPAVPAAGKTGTTQNGRDAWFVGFTDRYVVGVWLGNDDNSPMKGVAGGTLPARTWREIVNRLHGAG